MTPKNPIKSSLLACSALFAVGVLSGNARAQLLEGDVIVVTAQKKEEAANEVPLAISAFSGDDLETLGLTDTRDLAAMVPGLTFARSSSNTPIYTLRGVGFNTNNLSSTSPVGVYFDEASYPYPYMSQGLTFDVERVEVLKGPQGTLYGRNTTGGLINYIVAKPGDEFEGYLRVEGGKFETYGAEAVVGGPLTGSLGARAAFKYLQSDKGWQQSVSRPDDRNGEVDRLAGRFILDFHPSERLNATVTFNYWRDRGDTQAGQAINFNPEVFTPDVEAQALALFGGLFPPGTTGRQIAEALYVVPGLRDAILTNPTAEQADWAAPDQPAAWPGTTFVNLRPELGIDSEMLSVTGRIDYDITDNLTLTSLTNYIDLERDDVSDRGATQFELVTFRDLGSVESISQEIRLTGTAFDDRLGFIFGGFYSNDDLIDNSQVWAGQTSILNRLRVLVPAGAAMAGAPPEVVAEIAGGFRTWENFSTQDAETIAVFGQFDYRLTERLKFTGGLRYTSDNVDFAGCSRDNNGDENIFQLWNAAFGTSLVAGDCGTFRADFSGPVDREGAMGALDEDNIAARASLDFAATDNTLLYASFSRGFKSGSFPNLSANNETQYTPVTQEKLLAYEVGVKTSPAPGMQINASAYYYDYTDKQVFSVVLDPVFNTLTRLVNVPKSEIYGAELDINWTPVEDWFARLGVSYLNTEITEFQGFNEFAVPTDFAGSSFAYSPEWQISGLITKRFDITSACEGRLTLDASYTSDQQGDFQGLQEFAVDSYALLGGRLAVNPTSEAWELAIFARNITDKYYWTAVNSQTDTTFRYAGLPRTYGIELQFNF